MLCCPEKFYDLFAVEAWEDVTFIEVLTSLVERLDGASDPDTVRRCATLATDMTGASANMWCRTSQTELVKIFVKLNGHLYTRSNFDTFPRNSIGKCAKFLRSNIVHPPITHIPIEEKSDHSGKYISGHQISVASYDKVTSYGHDSTLAVKSSIGSGFLSEVAVTIELQGLPHVIPVEKIYYDSHRLYMVMKRMRCDLSNIGNSDFPDDQLEKLFEELTEGLKEIHSRGFLHNDIKLQNVVIDGNMKPYFIDFELSTKIHSHVAIFAHPTIYRWKKNPDPAIQTIKHDIYALNMMIASIVICVLDYRRGFKTDWIKLGESIPHFERYSEKLVIPERWMKELNSFNVSRLEDVKYFR